MGEGEACTLALRSPAGENSGGRNVPKHDFYKQESNASI
jgi:hypothetical protein